MGKDQDFLEAARNGNTALIEKVLSQKAKRAGPLASLRRGPGVNVQDSGGYSALHHACLNGHVEIVRLLLSNEANPNLPDTRGSSPLHLAAWAGEEEIVNMLLSHFYRPANPNLQTIENETPLHCAAQHGHTGALAFLLQHEADPNMCNSRGETPLDLAAQYGRLQAVQLLIRSHPELVAPFTNAAIEHQQLIHQKSRHSSPLPTSGSMSTPSPSSPSFTMLMANSSPSTPSRLVFPHTCLHLASRNGHKNVVEVLLTAGLSVNLLTPSGSALHEAALCGKENVVRILLKAGVDLNATDAEGRTALDILQEFPPHVTKHIVAVINNFRNQMDTDDGEDVVVLRNHQHQQIAPQHHYQSLQLRNGNNNINNNTNNNNNMNTNSVHYPKQQQQQHNANYHFNSNNHLLNHSMHSMQQSSYNKQPRQPTSNTTSNNNFNGGKSLDSSLHPEEIAYAVVGGGHRYYPQNSPVHSHSNHSQNELGVSPSSSVSSFEPASVSPRSRSSTGGIIGSNPMHMTTFGPGVPPKKPPRRNLSVSPTHAGQHFSYNSPNHQLQPQHQQLSNNSALRQHRSSSNESPYSHQSHGSVGGMSFDETQLRDRQRNDRLFASARDSTRSTSDDRLDQQQQQQIIEKHFKTNVPKEMNQEKTSTIRRPTPAPRNISKDIINCENPTLKSYNPNRKLKRNRNSYSITLGDMDQSFSSGSNSDPKPDIPRSPTNYKQPPTPDHPPPSSSQAEHTIHERIRPLSQEYKRRSALLNHQLLMIDTCTSPPKFLTSVKTDLLTSIRSTVTGATNEAGYQTVGRKQDSSGSLSSNISCSSQSGSTENVEEFVADSPFAGLLKGSTTNVKQTVSRTLQQHTQLLLVAEDQQKQRIRPPIPTKPTIISEKKIFRSSQQAQKNTDNEDNKYNGNESESGVSSFDSKENANNDEKQPSQDNESTTISTDEQLEVSNGFNSDIKQESNILSPFNAEEARKKISEIIETFGSGILDSNLATTNEIELDFDETVVSNERHELAVRLRNAHLLHLERILFENGYDNFKFLNGVMEESDMEIMQIPEADTSKLMKFVQTLPHAEFQPQILLHADNVELLSGVRTLNQWLCSIYLPEYLETFNKHLYNNLDSVCGVWDVELQTVLEINKVGHRKRILRSLDYMRQSGETKAIKTPLGENNDTNKPIPPTTNTKEHRMSLGGYRKNRPAPQPPIVKTEEETLQIRGPAELLLDLPANLRTKWRYSANVLLNEKIKYDVYYLGSTVVKELRGTESTRKSIKKLKRDERNSKPFMSSQEKSKHNLVSLAISHCGVEFIDINTKHTICEHEIQNINCACQDADDLRHFAYITKEHDLHYCHVFRVESTDLATDIILTLGQAFEVAYQLALRDGVKNHNTLNQQNNGTMRTEKISHN